MVQEIKEMKSVCVFCGAQNAVPQEHLDMARQLGRDMAAAGKQLVYGGGDCGLMGAVANGSLEAGGSAIGAGLPSDSRGSFLSIARQRDARVREHRHHVLGNRYGK